MAISGNPEHVFLFNELASLSLSIIALHVVKQNIIVRLRKNYAFFSFTVSISLSAYFKLHLYILQMSVVPVLLFVKYFHMLVAQSGHVLHCNKSSDTVPQSDTIVLMLVVLITQLLPAHYPT